MSNLGIISIGAVAILAAMYLTSQAWDYRDARKNRRHWEAVLEREEAASRQRPAERPTGERLADHARNLQQTKVRQEELTTRLHDTVRKARAEGISLKEVATLAGMSESAVRRIETGVRQR